MIALSLAAAGVAALLWSSGEAPGLRASADDVAISSAAAPAAPSVRVQHEYIEVSPPPVPPPPSRRARPARIAPLEPRKASSSPAFVERARRAILGDGRYRPDPFPRPASN